MFQDCLVDLSKSKFLNESRVVVPMKNGINFVHDGLKSTTNNIFHHRENDFFQKTGYHVRQQVEEPINKSMSGEFEINVTNKKWIGLKLFHEASTYPEFVMVKSSKVTTRLT